MPSRFAYGLAAVLRRGARRGGLPPVVPRRCHAGRALLLLPCGGVVQPGVLRGNVGCGLSLRQRQPGVHAASQATAAWRSARTRESCRRRAGAMPAPSPASTSVRPMRRDRGGREPRALRRRRTLRHHLHRRLRRRLPGGHCRVRCADPAPLLARVRLPRDHLPRRNDPGVRAGAPLATPCRRARRRATIVGHAPGRPPRPDPALPGARRRGPRGARRAPRPRRRFKAGDIVFSQGRQGLVDVRRAVRRGADLPARARTKDAPPVVLKDLRTGEYFGELALFDDKPRSASVRALVDTVLLELTREELGEHLGRSKTAAMTILSRDGRAPARDQRDAQPARRQGRRQGVRGEPHVGPAPRRQGRRARTAAGRSSSFLLGLTVALGIVNIPAWLPPRPVRRDGSHPYPTSSTTSSSPSWSSLQGPLIVMSQNRQTAKDRATGGDRLPREPEERGRHREDARRARRHARRDEQAPRGPRARRARRPGARRGPREDARAAPSAPRDRPDTRRGGSAIARPDARHRLHPPERRRRSAPPSRTSASSSTSTSSSPPTRSAARRSTTLEQKRARKNEIARSSRRRPRTSARSSSRRPSRSAPTSSSSSRRSPRRRSASTI